MMRRFQVTILCLVLFFLCLPAPPLMAKTEREEHCLFRQGDVNIQVPLRPLRQNGDFITDIRALCPLFGLQIEQNQDKILIHKGKHELLVRVGKRGAFLDGRFILLQAPPHKQHGRVLLPVLQMLRLFQVAHHVEGEQVVIDAPLPKLSAVRQALAAAGERKQQLAFVGILDGERWVLALRPQVQKEHHGYSALYELHGGKGLVLRKLRAISDTSATVYLEWMPGGAVVENIAMDTRPEFLFIESCACSGRYHYATLFTLTELGVQPLWHSSATFAGVQKNGKRYELITLRRENIPDLPVPSLPYWEVHEAWIGQTFAIVREVYHDPLQSR